MIKKIMIALVIWLCVNTILFFCFAFAWCKLNPVYWNALDRGLLSFFCAISGIIIFVITFRKEIEL